MDDAASTKTTTRLRSVHGQPAPLETSAWLMTFALGTDVYFFFPSFAQDGGRFLKTSMPSNAFVLRSFAVRAQFDTKNADGHTTRRGKKWNPVQVMRVLEKAKA